MKQTGRGLLVEGTDLMIFSSACWFSEGCNVTQPAELRSAAAYPWALVDELDAEKRRETSGIKEDRRGLDREAAELPLAGYPSSRTEEKHTWTMTISHQTM